MKAVQSSALAMSDLFRAVAGAPEAQFDMIACTVYSAAFSIMQAGNKTQFNKLAADAKLYGSDSTEANKAIKDALGIKSLNAAAKHFRKTYFAVQIALDQLGIPADMQKELPKGKAEIEAILAPLADAYACEFASVFTATLMMPEKTEAERTEASAQAKAKREAKAKEAEEAKKQEEKALVERTLAGLKPITLADMARDVLRALAAGELDAETEAALIEAARVRETAVLLASVAQPEAMPA